MEGQMGEFRCTDAEAGYEGVPAVKFVLCDELLNIALPMETELEEPLSFQGAGELTHDQFAEIVRKSDGAEMHITGAYSVFRDFLQSYDLREKPREYFARLYAFLNVAKWFDAGIQIWLEEWYWILTGGAPEVPYGLNSAGEHAGGIEQVLDAITQLGASLKPRLVAMEENAALAAIVSKEYVDQKEATHILHVSDTVLRQFCNDRTVHPYTEEALNGILEGKLWRFSREEVHRFGRWYWGPRAKPSSDPRQG